MIDHGLASRAAELWKSPELLRITATAVAPVLQAWLQATCWPRTGPTIVEAVAVLLLIDFCDCLQSSARCDQGLARVAIRWCRGSEASAPILQVLTSEVLTITANHLPCHGDSAPLGLSTL